MQLTAACQRLCLICITIRKASDVTSKQPGSRQSFNTSCSPELGANMLSTIAWLDLTVVTKAPTHALVTSDQDWSNRFKQQNKRTGDWCWSRKDNKKQAFNSEDLWDIRKATEERWGKNPSGDMAINGTPARKHVEETLSCRRQSVFWHETALWITKQLWYWSFTCWRPHFNMFSSPTPLSQHSL